MNNRNQKINFLLDSLTLKELEDYLKKKNIDKKKLENLKQIELHKEVKGEINHSQKLFNKIYSNNINDMVYFGQAQIIAYALSFGFHDYITMQDLINFYKRNMDSEPKLKEYVYEIMKDL